MFAILLNKPQMLIVSCVNLKLHIYHMNIHLLSVPVLCVFPSLFDIRMAACEECVGGIHSELKKSVKKGIKSRKPFHIEMVIIFDVKAKIFLCN